MIACAKWLGRAPDTCTRGDGCICKTEGAKRYQAKATQDIDDILHLKQLVPFEDGHQGYVDTEHHSIEDGKETWYWTVRIASKNGWRTLCHQRTIN